MDFNFCDVFHFFPNLNNAPPLDFLTLPLRKIHYHKHHNHYTLRLSYNTLKKIHYHKHHNHYTLSLSYVILKKNTLS